MVEEGWRKDRDRVNPRNQVCVPWSKHRMLTMMVIVVMYLLLRLLVFAMRMSHEKYLGSMDRTPVCRIAPTFAAWLQPWS